MGQLEKYVAATNERGKATPKQSSTGPEGSRRLRFPDFETIGRVYPPGSIPDRNSVDPDSRIMSMKNSNDTMGNRTRNPLTFIAVPQPTAPLRAPTNKEVINERKY